MTLTVTHTNSIASVGSSAAQNGKAVSGEKASDSFGSLLATLFGIAEQIVGQTDIAAGLEAGIAQPGEALKDQLIGPDGKPLGEISGLDITALLDSIQTKLEANASADATTPPAPANPEQLIAALVKVLQGLDGTVNTAQLTDAQKAVDAIVKLLADAKGQTSAPASGTPPNSQASVQAEALASLAEKFTLQAPELSAKLSQLSDKLAQLAPPAASTPQDSEQHKALQALFGEKQVTGKASNTPLSNALPTGAAKGPDQSAASATSPIDATKLDLHPTKVLTEVSAQQSAKPTPPSGADATIASVAAAAAKGSAMPAAKSETAPQTDALLLAQSSNQLGIKTEIASAVKPMTAAYQTPTQNLNLPHIAFAIARNHQDGMSRFQIRLDPPEMGRIDVRLNVDGAGNLHARMTVDRADTLDLLQRDARALERALQQAGIENGRTNLEFSLRQNPFARQDSQQQGGQNPGEVFALDDTSVDAAIPDLPAAIYYRGTASPGGINMFA